MSRVRISSSAPILDDARRARRSASTSMSRSSHSSAAPTRAVRARQRRSLDRCAVRISSSAPPTRDERRYSPGHRSGRGPSAPPSHRLHPDGDELPGRRWGRSETCACLGPERTVRRPASRIEVPSPCLPCPASSPLGSPPGSRPRTRSRPLWRHPASIAAAALALTLATVPLLPDGDDDQGTITPSGEATRAPGAASGRGEVTPEMQAEIDRVLAEGASLDRAQGRTSLARASVRCADLRGPALLPRHRLDQPVPRDPRRPG